MKYDRQQRIKQLFIERRELSCKELCGIFEISIETVRRDLAALEEEGVIKRVYGGAVLSDNSSVPSQMKPWDTRVILNNAEKSNMARVMLSYIQDGMTIALDSGTTLLTLARLLDQRRNLTIITNDLRIASEVSRNTDHMIYLVGGSLKRDDKITVGFMATEFLNNFLHVDAAILTCDGFANGIGDFNPDMAALKSAMIRKAGKVYAMIDHTKFTIQTLYKVCCTHDIDLLVTGNEAPRDMIENLKKEGVSVVLVPCR